MKKITKIIIITLVIFFSLIIIGILIAPPIAKNYINKHGKELIGRKVTIEKLYANLFTGYNRICGFTLYETNDSDTFISFDTLVVDLSLYRLIVNELRINEISLINPKVNLWQKGETFNFTDLLKKHSTDTLTAPEDTTSNTSSLAIAIYNINLAGGHIRYKDLIRNSLWDMEDMNLRIPGVYFSGQNTDVGINLNFSNGGSLQTQTQYNLTDGEYLVHLNLNNFAIDNLQAYLADYVKIGRLNGSLSADLEIAGNTNHIMDISRKGLTSLRELHITDEKAQKIVSIDSVGLDIEEINPGTAKFRFNALAIHKFSFSFELYSDHNNYTAFLKEESGTPADTVPETPTAAPDTTAIPMDLRLGKLAVTESDFTFNDHTLHKPFSFRMDKLSIISDTLTLSGVNHIRLQTKLPDGGSAYINWKGKLDDISNLDLTLAIKNLNLIEFTPYCLQYFGYPIRKGNLAFTSINTVKKSQLEGRNSLDVFACELENKQKGLKVEYNLPLKTALYLIKDKNDKINMNLPVSGNISSPEFSYRKLIFKTLTNLLIKVAVSPVSFLANSLGFSPDKLSSIPLTATQWDFTSEQYSTFNALTELIKAKPDMTLTLEQEIDREAAYNEIALFDIKKDYYLSLHSEKSDTTLQAIDYAKIMEIETKDPNFNSYLNSKVDPSISTLSVQEKTRSLLSATFVESQINRLIELRNRQTFNYLTTQGIPADHLKVTTSQATDYSGKHQYKINLVLEEDQQSEITE